MAYLDLSMTDEERRRRAAEGYQAPSGDVAGGPLPIDTPHQPLGDVPQPPGLTIQTSRGPYDDFLTNERDLPGGTRPSGVLPGGPSSRETAYAQYQEAFKPYLPGGLRPEEERAFNDYWNQSLEAGLMSGPGYGQSWDTIYQQSVLPYAASRFTRPTASAGGVGGDADLNGDAILDATGLPTGWAGGTGAMQPLPVFQRQPTGPADRTGGPTPLPLPAEQFDDPYSNLYERAARQGLERTQTDPNMEALMRFLTQQFQTFGSQPGHTPEDLAVLQTQALEPIEALRRASQQRITERAGARGMLPSSGLIQGEQAETDRRYDQLRAEAQRAVAIDQMNRRRSDLSAALGFGQAAVAAPRAQTRETLDLANILYQMPRQAQMDALNVINASSPQSAMQSLINLLQLRQQQSQFDAVNSQQFWAALGNALAGMSF